MFWIATAQCRHGLQKLEALDRSLAIIEFSPEGAILSANENFCRTLGYRQAELAGQHHRLFVEPAYAQSEDYRAFWRKLSSGAFDAGVYTRLRKDGSHAYIRATYNPVKDKTGRVVSVLKVAADVTESRIESMENASRMAALSQVQCVVEFKPNGEVIEANDRFLAAMGYRRDQVIGRNHSLFVDPAFAASEDYRAFWRRLNAGEAIVDSFPRVGADGRKIWLQASYSPVFDLDGRIYKIIKFANDITDLLKLGDGLARLSRGDLSERLETPFAPTFDKLRADFNNASENLARVLAGVAEASGVLDGGAREIASAARDLSGRTEGQAASLEETAAALASVTERVGAATKNARTASQVVGAAKGDAGKSGEIVAHAVAAMGRLEHSSKEIGAIIGVIDEIAFQTNLLALNAGVEAARAGEAGRGFAVVAMEVRALAQRSAEAAKQIKGLISTSANDVSAGVDLVRKAGDSLGDIVAKVIEIDKLVGGIAGGAEEQNVALAEVNIAVGRMDQATQQNAAMAEQASAAAASLNTQIERLNQALSGFLLTPARAKRAPRLAA